MALRNRTLQEENKLRGTDRSKDSAKFKLGQFHTLKNWIPAHVYSIKKKRGVQTLVTSLLTPQVPVPCGVGGCVPATDRGQQLITVETRFVQIGSLVAPLDPLETNLRTSWGHIATDETVWTVIGAAGCAGGNMSYVASCMQNNKFETPAVLTHPALIQPDAFLPFINCVMGSSDIPLMTCRESAFVSPNDNVKYFYLWWTTQPMQWGYSDFPDLTYCKFGDRLYLPGRDASNPSAPATDGRILVFAWPPVTDFDPPVAQWVTGLTDFHVYKIQATANYVYVYGDLRGDLNAVIANSRRIYKIDRTTGAIVATFHLDDLPVSAIAVVDDTLIYLIGSTGGVFVSYIANFNTLKFLGRTTGVIGFFSPFNITTAQFVNSSIYWGGTGFSGFTTDIYRIVTACSLNGQPSISVSEASVAAGGNITVNWTNVLDPSNQRAVLVAAPVGGKLGFHTILTNVSTGDTSSGSVAMTIPGGTPPGNYVTMLTEAGGTIYVATSNVFAVT